MIIDQQISSEVDNDVCLIIVVVPFDTYVIIVNAQI